MASQAARDAVQQRLLAAAVSAAADSIAVGAFMAVAGSTVEAGTGANAFPMRK
jgi:hypothetical protein